MNFSVHLSQRSHHWLKELQLLAGIVVVIGGAAVLLAELLVLLKGLL